MSRHTLATEIRGILAALRRSMGWAAVVVGVLCLPFVLLAAYATLPFMWAGRRLAGESLWPEGRSLTLDQDGLAFAWSGDRESARQSLEDAVHILVESLPELAGVSCVEILELRNPHTGFALDPQALGEITGDFVARLTQSFWGSKLEYGELVVNGEVVLGGLALDARTATTGHLEIDLDSQGNREGLLRRAAGSGFTIHGGVAPDGP